MFIAHEYPFNMIEYKRFTIFAKALNYKYQKVSRVTLKSDCVKVYQIEKDKLKNMLKNVSSNLIHKLKNLVQLQTTGLQIKQLGIFASLFILLIKIGY